jgi:UDP-N-acetylglucosamine 2-epimerase (non-hydrolysing)
MLDQVLGIFEIVPDYDLDLMRRGQTLAEVTSSVLTGIDQVISNWRPSRILVQGDTCTTFAASLAAYYCHVPVGHVEAGLRTGNIYAPWPEEINRKLTASIADLHFAPTVGAKANLIKEGVPEAAISVTGNTVIDALLWAEEILEKKPGVKAALDRQFEYLDGRKALVLVTGHRRESFGQDFESICLALKDLARSGDVQILFPVHLNPNVREPVHRILSSEQQVFLTDPQDYLTFVYLMKKAYLVLTDSGGIQEEAPALGKPVLVLRDTTERPEAVAAGVAKVIGSNRDRVRTEVNQLLRDEAQYRKMARGTSPFGDGNASVRIVKTLSQLTDNHCG